MDDVKDELQCSFCRKLRKDVAILIAGPEIDGCGVMICDSCLDTGYNFLHKAKGSGEQEAGHLYAKDLKAKLDEYVIGQEDAKRKLSVAVSNHQKRINNDGNLTCEIEKSNIIMVGPSGCGKTLLLKTIAKIAGVPCTVCNSTALTETGYVGQDVESIFEDLVLSADGDIDKAEHGIVFLDEIDKKAKSKVSGASGRDVSGEGVQQALLKMVEGTELLINPDPTNKNPNKLVPFNTKDVLFIAGGAFMGLEEIVRKRKNKGSGVGVGAKVSKGTEADVALDVTAIDLTEYGLIREFIGRFPIIVSLHDLGVDMLSRVLIEPKNNLLDQYKELFRLDGIELSFSDEYLRQIAATSYEHKTGARGLRNSLEDKLSDIQFDIKDYKEQGITHIAIEIDGTTIFNKNTEKACKIL